jgi:hypothetical protein
MNVRLALLLSVVVAVLAPGRAHAQTLTASPSTIPIGNVTLEDSATGTTTVSGTATIASFDTSMGGPGNTPCDAAFSITTPTPVVVAGSATITAQYAPSAAGAESCVVTMLDALDGILGTFTITGTGIVWASVTPTSQDFGSVRWNPAAPVHSSTFPFTIDNASPDHVLTVVSITTTGGDAGDFTVNAAPTSIGSGGSAPFTVTFAPSAGGTRATTLEVTTDDPNMSTIDVPLTGTATNGVISVTTPVSFGVVPDATGSAQTITVSNIAATPVGPLGVTGASIAQTSTWFAFAAGDGCAAGSTTCTFSPAFSITPPATGSVSVTCTPPAGATGMQTATVTFASDTDDTTHDASMLTCTAGLPVITPSTTSLTFNPQIVATTSMAQDVMLSNTGNEGLVYSATIQGANPGSFSLGASCVTNCDVPMGMAGTLSVTFTPQAQGALTATIVITSNDTDDTPLDITLSGTGIGPDIGGPASLAFSTVSVGTNSSPMMLTVTNTGTSPLTITNAALTAGTGDYLVTTGTTGTQTTTLGVGSNDSWNIECSPSTQGSRPGTFTVTSNALNTPSLGVPLTCTGQQGVLTVTPNPFDFSGVRVDTTASQTFTLKNTGNVTVSNISAMLSNSMLGYSITSPTFPIASLAAGATQSVTVQFAPLATTDGGAINLTFSGTWNTSFTAMTVLALNGEALAAGYSTNPASPNALAFGDIRFDQTETLTYSVVDTDSTPVNIESQTIAPTNGTPTGAFTITGCTHGGSPVTCPVAGTPFQLSGVNDTLVVSVQCNPQNMVAMLTATVTVTSDLTANPNRSLGLTATSTSAELGVTPASNLLDFGNIDLEAGPVTQTITLTNTGQATLNTAQATIGGANAARYQFSPLGPQAIAPGSAFEVQVTYTPTTEAAANQFDVASLSFPLTGIFGGPNMLVVSIQGRGIDRHIAAGNAPTFPDTFVNPGNTAPVLPFTVTNTGEAVLSISAVMLNNEPVWTLVNPDPVDIPGGESYAFMIQFSPTTAGRAPQGNLVLSDDDTHIPMVSLALNGNGIDRNVQMTPAVIDLGYAGVGIPAKLSSIAPSELLAIASADPAHTFTIRTIDVDGGDGAFVITNTDGKAPQDVSLAPDATQKFDITFTPSAAGPYTATATLYLDMDPTAQATVQLQGQGVEVTAQGGGGCSTGGNAGGAMLVVVLGWLSLRRRRRGHGAVAAALIVAGSAVAAHADNRSLDLSVFDPTPSTSDDSFQLQGATVGPANSAAFTALLSYASDPLVLTTAQNDDAAISARTMLELGGAYALLGRIELAARLPLYVQSGQTIDSTSEFGVPPASGTALGNLTLGAKGLLWRGTVGPGELATGLAAALTLPTASSGEFAGSTDPEGRVLALASFTPAQLSRLVAIANVGAVLRAQSQFANIDQGSGLAWGVGAAYHVLDEMWASAELYGEVVPSGIRDMPTTGMATGASHALTTIEALVGVRYQMDAHVNLGAALGRGVTDGVGSPDFRGVVLLAVHPSAVAVTSIHPPVDETRDSDGDGIPDVRDRCPNEPEDKDGFEDADGCPDPDNDQDGIPDAQDKCPNEPEDKDGFQDEDGCPDPDNDGDGIPDSQDKCPNEPEDHDGFQDADGCPDFDNDHDGIPDAQDKCPNEPETINGYQDDDGCPDKGDPQVLVSADRLELLESVRWNGPRLAKNAANLLGQIGATLRAHPEIVRVRVTVYVQPTGDADRDQALSDTRAAAIRDWLVQWGVAASRVEPHGFGSRKPLVAAERPGAAQINDRVELVILERK